MKKFSLVGIILIAMSLIACQMPGMGKSSEKTATQSNDNGVYELKISTSQTDQSAITKAYTELAKRLNKKSNGKLKVEVFSSGQLGSDENVIEQAIQGSAVAVNTDAARMGTYVNDMGILMMGYFADNYEECLKVTNTETFKQWENELASKHGIHVISFNFYDGARHFMTNKEIKEPSDLKGLRIRTIGAPVCIETISAMGATPIAMDWGEVYNGIQSKSLDGAECQNTSSYPARLYEVAKIQSKTGHFQLLQGLVCGETWFQTLPKDLQNLLIETAKEVGEESAKVVQSESSKAEEEMKKSGLKVIEPNIAAFKESVKPAYEKLGYTQLREKLYQEIGKNREK